jgi:hypothetical protein
MSSVEACLARWAPWFEPKPSGLLEGDPEGEPVLRELRRWPNERVRQTAERALQFLAPTGS